jgi:hypothetical protein
MKISAGKGMKSIKGIQPDPSSVSIGTSGYEPGPQTDILQNVPSVAGPAVSPEERLQSAKKFGMDQSTLDAIDSIPLPNHEGQASDAVPNLLLPDSAPPAQAPNVLDLPDKESPLVGLYKQVAAQSPDKTAKVLSLSKTLDQPPAFVDKNLPQAEQAATAPHPSFFAELESQYPESTKFLSSPENMGVAHDDMPNVAAHEALVQEAVKSRTLHDAFKAGYQNSLYGIIYRQKAPEMQLDPEAPALHRFAAGAAGIAGDLPFMIGGGIAGGLGGASVASAPGAILGGAAGGFGAPAALKEGLLEHFRKGDIKNTQDLIDRSKSIVSTFGKQTAVGILTELTGMGTGFLAEKAALAPLATGAAKLATEAGALEVGGKGVEGEKPTVAGYLDNLALIGAMKSTGALVDTHGPAELSQAEQAKNFYTALGDTAEASKLRSRMPESHLKLVKDITEGGPVENVYIPIEDAKTYFQGKNIPIDQVVDSLDIRKAYEEAQATGGDIKIPLSTWVSKVVGTEHYKGLADDVKFSPEDLTVREAQNVHDDVAAQVQAMEEQALKEAPSSIENSPHAAKIEAAAKIYEDIQSKLKAAGLSPDEVRYNPKVHEAFFTTIGERLGVDPYELQQKFPLEIRNVEAENQNSLTPKQERKYAQSGKIEKPADIKLDYRPNEGDLTKAQRAAEENLGRILSDPKAESKYAEIPESMGGKFLDTDIARQLSPEFSAGRKGAVLHTQSTHAPAGQFIWDLYKKKLEAKPEGPVLLMAGGAGSGKSSVFHGELKEVADHSEIIYDGTGQRLKDQVEKIDMALASGRPVANAFIYAPVDAAAERAASRFQKRGRTIPPEQFVEGHVTALANYLALAEKYKDTKGVTFKAFDNSGGKTVEISLEKLNELRYNKEGETVAEAVQRLLPKAKEVLSEAEQEVEKARNKSRNAEEASGPERSFKQAGASEPAGGGGRSESRKSEQGREGQLAPPFYSKLTRTVEEKMGGSATPEQIQGMLKEIKPEERKWLGIDDFLKGKEKVSKEALLEFLRGNAVDIKEITKSPLTENSFNNWITSKYGDKWLDFSDEQMIQAKADFKSEHEGAGPTKFQSYTLPGGENYREVLFQLPPAEAAAIDPTNGWDHRELRTGSELWTRDVNGVSAKIRHDNDGTYKLQAYGTNFAHNGEFPSFEAAAKELVSRVSDIATAKMEGNYKSSHFDEPNVLAHTRLNDRLDSAGKKVLFVEEIQSDWHQAGRKKGYKEGPTAHEVAKKELFEYKAMLDDKYDGRPATNASPEEKAKWNELSDRYKASFDDGKFGAVPDAPFKKTWHEFVLKRLIREAAEKGYDKIAWTTGEQQAERYDLSKQVDRVNAHKNKDGTFSSRGGQGPRYR